MREKASQELEKIGPAAEGMLRKALDAFVDGNVESVIDGALTLSAYYALCEAEGLPRPNVLVD